MKKFLLEVLRIKLNVLILYRYDGSIDEAHIFFSYEEAKKEQDRITAGGEKSVIVKGVLPKKQTI